jgi:hypothetical protein
LIESLRQAALLMSLQNRLNGFFLGRINERTCINYQDVGIICARCDFHTARQHAAKHDLRVDQVLCAAEADHANLDLLSWQTCRLLFVLRMVTRSGHGCHCKRRIHYRR